MVLQQHVVVFAGHSLDVVTHGLAPGPLVAALAFGNAEAEVVGVAHVGRDAHLENAQALVPLTVLDQDDVAVVGVLCHLVVEDEVALAKAL